MPCTAPPPVESTMVTHKYLHLSGMPCTAISFFFPH